MTVRCLTKTEKQFIAEEYTKKKMLQKELAEFFGVSERTINRVLIEMGLATPVERIKGEAYQVMQLLKEYDVSREQLQLLLEDCVRMRMLKVAA